MYLKTEEEIELIRESSLLVGKTLAEVAKLIKPGVQTLRLDQLAEEYIRDNGAVPGFKGLYGCPSTLLTSVNSEVVHGLPSKEPLRNGDIVSIDCGVLKNEFYGDVAYTFEVGEVSADVKALLETTKECLKAGIEAAKAGNRIGDIGYAIQSHAEEKGYSVVRELVGHGLGRKLHEDPQVPNYGRRGNGVKLREGLVIAIEPMINMGKRHVKQGEDGWTIFAKDGLPSAHFEHDIVVRKEGAEVLSTHEFVEEALKEKENN